MLDAVVAIGLQQLTDFLAGGADTRQVGRCLQAFPLDFQHGAEGAILGGPAGTKGDGEKLWLQRCQLLPGGAQLFGAFRSFGRKELQAEIVFGLCGHDVHHVKRDRHWILSRLLLQ